MSNNGFIDAGSPIPRLATLLAQAGMLSEVSAQNLESGSQSAEDPLGPPGTFSTEPTFSEELNLLLHRLSDVLDIQLQRIKGGDVVRFDRSRDEDDINKRIRTVWRGQDPKWIAYVEGVDEKLVLSVLKAS